MGGRVTCRTQPSCIVLPPPCPPMLTNTAEDAERKTEFTVEYSFPYITSTNTQSIHLEGNGIKMGAIFFFLSEITVLYQMFKNI